MERGKEEEGFNLVEEKVKNGGRRREEGGWGRGQEEDEEGAERERERIQELPKPAIEYNSQIQHPLHL